jgi:hypothetical protein
MSIFVCYVLVSVRNLRKLFKLQRMRIVNLVMLDDKLYCKDD